MYNYSTKRHSLGKEGNRACYGLLKQSRRHVHCSTRGCITKWTGHVMRMEDSRLPKQIFCSELARDTRKRYRDSLKNSQRACDISVKGWEHLAADGSAWRLATHNEATQAFEERRLSQLDIKRQVRTETKANPAAAVACPVWGMG